MHHYLVLKKAYKNLERRLWWLEWNYEQDWKEKAFKENLTFEEFVELINNIKV